MASLSDPTASLEARARSYLSIHCAHCHCRGGGGTVALELPFSTPTDKMNAIDQLPTQGNFGIENARVIVPGDPYRSVLYYRLATSGAGHMPKLWMLENDSEGLQVVHDWIASMEPEEKLASKPIETAERAANPSDLSVTEALQRFHTFVLGRVNSTEREAFLASIKSDADPVIRGLFERFLPASERVQRLGSQIDRHKILALSGDAQTGATNYRESAALQCRNCHRIGGLGQSVGPDLDGIAKKRSRDDLLESILEPSKRIEPDFQNHSILTADGEIITGLLLERSDLMTVLRSADGKVHSIANDSIEETRTLGVSLMPAGLAAEMTADELANLLAYLESLR
jgi:putative heme-binding domain-containing protein